MQFDIDEAQCKKAKFPHEIFLINLVAIHILWFVAALGIVKTLPYPLLATPLMSASILGYILWRANKSKNEDDWFVQCHWQIAAQRSKVFMGILALLITVSALGWIGYTYLGMMKVAVLAFIGGVGMLPTMVSVLALIIMESDAMHQGAQGKLGKSILEKYPAPAHIKILDED